jgi:hypothetical protein
MQSMIGDRFNVNLSLAHMGLNEIIQPSSSPLDPNC